MPLKSTDPVAVCTIAEHGLSILASTCQKVAVGCDSAETHLVVRIICIMPTSARLQALTCKTGLLLVLSDHGRPMDSAGASSLPFSQPSKPCSQRCWLAVSRLAVPPPRHAHPCGIKILELLVAHSNSNSSKPRLLRSPLTPAAVKAKMVNIEEERTQYEQQESELHAHRGPL